VRDASRSCAALKALVFIVTVILPLGSAEAQRGLTPRPSDPAATPIDALRDIGIEQRLNQQLPLDVVLRDEAGRSVRLGQYFTTRPVLLVLAYYECPMLCTLVLRGVASAHKALPFEPGGEFEVITVSFDPAETPRLAAAAKAQYVREVGRAGAQDGWHFLTGSAAAIAQITRAVGFRYKYDEARDEFAHAAAIIVLTPAGRIARYFFGIEYSPRDLRFGLIEASQHRIGSTADRLMLLCYRYDPAAGKYSLVALRVVRLAGVVTVVALGAFLVMSLRTERRTPPPQDRSNGGVAPPPGR
jgi:protein SCO1/2